MTQKNDEFEYNVYVFGRYLFRYLPDTPPTINDTIEFMGFSYKIVGIFPNMLQEKNVRNINVTPIIGEY